MPAIASLETRLVEIPLRRAWGEDVREMHVVETVVRDTSGGAGWGFSWTPTIGAHAVEQLLARDIADHARGLPADPRIWQGVWEHLHEAGSGGITTIALAGLDLALWDLAARRQDRSVTDLIGRAHDRLPAYGSGVNLHYSADELAAQVRRWVDQGFDAVKIKVGSADLARDVDRVEAVREILGAGRALMIDANQRWDLERATTAIYALSRFDPAWIEEPLRADDIAGHAELRRRIGVPIALGENRHTIYQFRDAIDAGAVDIIQPNVVRVGGITPFLAITELARERGVRIAPHLLPELSSQLAFCLPDETWVEDVEDAGFFDLGALAAPTGLDIRAGIATGGPARGLGIRFA
ncbi:mandelate racemase/muconate lactonizing enzyme family protein [Microbacterium excoecariae]|uniref:mandelate racemase/muconate lactonizing enzyme family protein n=1 Tax=Microbacterium excoecariae TaxID=2715210 RepID=UPI00197BF9DD|nr:mandelate racemase/muconate lactonizing enzyme family protein [Microbacterium excoecariae]NHI17409.1 mandelate racemase/muconate lactonizing enzyme family protein [Microbacterium excoecariae]